MLLVAILVPFSCLNAFPSVNHVLTFPSRVPIPSRPNASLDFDRERLQVLIVTNVGIDSIPDDFSGFIAVFLTPFLILGFLSLGFLFLGKTEVSYGLQPHAEML